MITCGMFIAPFSFVFAIKFFVKNKEKKLPDQNNLAGLLLSVVYRLCPVLNLSDVNVWVERGEQ